MALSKIDIANMVTGTLPNANFSEGKVLQVLQATDSTQRSNTQGSDVGNQGSFSKNSTTLAVSITPSATSSKILIIASTSIFKATNGEMFMTFVRGSTNLGHADKGLGYYNQAANLENWTKHLYDSPNTTSATEYSVQFKSSNTNAAQINYDGALGHITVMEIRA